MRKHRRKCQQMYHALHWEDPVIDPHLINFLRSRLFRIDRQERLRTVKLEG